MLSIDTTIKRADSRFYKLKPMKTMGDRIADRLAELKSSQHWLAKAVGISQPSINAVIKKPEAGSKHIVKIAEALGVEPKWLTEGKGPKFRLQNAEAKLVGEVGAGSEVNRLEHGDVLEGVPLALSDAPNVARITGDSQHPLRAGWLIFYGQEFAGITDDCIGELCVVQVKDGPTLLKTLKRGSKRGLYDLESWNAPAREDVRVVWAARVRDIRPK